MAQRGVNKVILVGNLGGDPESKTFPSGGMVTNCTIATSETWKDKNTGEPQEKTEWHRLVFYNRLAEIAAEYLRKGAKIYVEGRLQTRSWEQDGIKRYATEIIVGEMQMLDGKRDGGGSSAPASSSSSAQAQSGGQAAPKQNFDNFDDDIPF